MYVPLVMSVALGIGIVGGERIAVLVAMSVLDVQWWFAATGCWLTGLKGSVCCSPENCWDSIDTSVSSGCFVSVRRGLGGKYSMEFVTLSLGGCRKVAAMSGFCCKWDFGGDSIRETLCALPLSKNPVYLHLLWIWKQRLRSSSHHPWSWSEIVCMILHRRLLRSISCRVVYRQHS